MVDEIHRVGEKSNRNLRESLEKRVSDIYSDNKQNKKNREVSFSSSSSDYEYETGKNHKTISSDKENRNRNRKRSKSNG
jgi:hypothetical protein